LDIKLKMPYFDDKEQDKLGNKGLRIKWWLTRRIKVVNLSDHKSNPLGMESHPTEYQIVNDRWKNNKNTFKSHT
jgi:hypothetical protein